MAELTDLEQRVARIEERLGIVSEEKTTSEDEWVYWTTKHGYTYRANRDGSIVQFRCSDDSEQYWNPAYEDEDYAYRKGMEVGRRAANKELAKAVLDMSNVTPSAVSDDATWNEWWAWEHKVLSLARAIVHEEDDEGV